MRRTLPLSLLALMAVGCERMPEDPVFAYGRVQHEDGSPHASAELRVERTVLSSGFDGTPPEDRTFRPYSETRTEANGEYTLSFLYSDVFDEDRFNYTYTQYRFRAYPPLGEDGSGVFVSFHFRDDMELPPLRPWSAGLAVSDGPEGPALSFAPAPPVPETPPSGELPRYYETDQTQFEMPPTPPEPVVQLHTAGGLLWQQKAASPWVASPYVREDFGELEAQVRAVTQGTWYFYPLASNGSDVNFRLEWRSPRLPLPGGALRPVSRGAACSPMPQGTSGPCPFTDGKLVPVETLTHEGGGGTTPTVLGVPSLTFALGSTPVQPRRMVLRGLVTSMSHLHRIRVVLEGSADGFIWPVLADVPVEQFPAGDEERVLYGFYTEGSERDSPWDGPLDVHQGPLWLEVPLTGDSPVRQVRLTVKADAELPYPVPENILGLTELSLFE